MPGSTPAVACSFASIFAFEPLERRALLSASLTFGGAQSLVVNPNIRVSIDSTTRQSEMSIAVNPTNPLNVVAFTHRINATSMATYYTFDGGVTWTPRLIDSSIDGITATQRFDPTLAFDSQGRLYVAYGADPSGGTRRLVVIRSLDGGVTYPTFSVVNTQSSLDKWIIGTGRDPLNANQQNVYIAYRITAGAVTAVRVACSYNNGVTWPVDELVPDDAQAGADFSSFGMPTVGPNGELYVIWEDYDPAPLASLVKAAYSVNAGFAYAADVTIDNTLITRDNANGFTPSGATRYHIAAQPDRGILAVPSIAVDRSNGPRRGRLYAAFTEGGVGGGTNNTDVRVRWSDDNGQTWSTPASVHDAVTNQGSQFLPWLDVDDHSGAIAVAYYDTRNSPTNQLAELWVSASVDGGTTWTETRVASMPSNQSLSNGSRYLGNYLEYIGVAVRDGTIHAAWADNRISAGDLELFTASISIDSLSSANTLSIVPDPAVDNSVVVRRSAINPQFIEVLVNGIREYSGLAGTVDRVHISTGNGKDTIQVLDLAASAQVVIRAGANDDKIDVRETGIPGAEVGIDSGAGSDSLLVNTQGTGSSAAILVGSDDFELIEIGDNGSVSLLAQGGLLISTQSLAIATNGTFDLFDNDLLIDYTTTSPASTVQGYINSARAGGAWTGFGLTSNGARIASPANTALGLLEGSEYQGLYGVGATFGGAIVDSTMVLVKYTYYGDTDFNGLVNFDDYSRTDAGFNLNRTGWLNGDFDGNGVVNFDDYSLIDLAFNTQGAPRSEYHWPAVKRRA